MAYDESVEKLENFCRLLTQVNGDLRSDADAVEAREDSLEHTEDATSRGLEDLGRDLDELRAGVEHGEAAATGALDHASEAAGAAQARLEAEASELTEADATFHERVDAQRADLEQAGGALEQEGLAPLVASSQEVNSGLETARAQAEADFATLNVALETDSATVTQAADRASSAIAEDTEAMDGATRALEAEGTSCADGWGEELPATFEEGYGASVEEATTAYEQLGSEATVAGDALVASLTELCEDWAGRYAAELGSAMEGAASMARGALDLYSGQAMLFAVRMTDEGVALSNELEPLVGELEKANAVIPVVEELLAALG